MFSVEPFAPSSASRSGSASVAAGNVGASSVRGGASGASAADDQVSGFLSGHHDGGGSSAYRLRQMDDSVDMDATIDNGQDDEEVSEQEDMDRSVVVGRLNSSVSNMDDEVQDPLRNEDAAQVRRFRIEIKTKSFLHFIIVLYF